VTIADVAKTAGVSAMTVSRVIRGEPYVREETRVRVMKAMSDLQYVPSGFARSRRSSDQLLSQSLSIFAIIFGRGIEGAQSFFHDITIGAEKEAATHGLCPLNVKWQESFNDSWSRLQTVFSIKGLFGVILAGHFYPEEISAIHNRIDNIVVVDGPAPDQPEIGAVESDNLRGCMAALEHLIDKGARRILAISIAPDHYWSIAMKMAVNELRSCSVDIRLEYDCVTSEDAYRLVTHLWDEGNSFDGIFSDDECAFGVLKAMRDMNIAVPEEVKVVGFDDTPFARFTEPPLTSIRIDKYLLGSESVRTLVEMSKSERKSSGIKKIIRSDLVVRQST